MAVSIQRMCSERVRLHMPESMLRSTAALKLPLHLQHQLLRKMSLLK
jgi:hypothetical protein